MPIVITKIALIASLLAFAACAPTGAAGDIPLIPIPEAGRY